MLGFPCLLREFQTACAKTHSSGKQPLFITGPALHPPGRCLSCRRRPRDVCLPACLVFVLLKTCATDNKLLRLKAQPK